MNLTLQFVPFEEINSLAPEKRINRLLDIVKKDKIVLLQGRLKPSEEAWLIQKTMEHVSKDFKGIELCTIYPELKDQKVLSQMKGLLVKFLMGAREGLTIIGPANVVKEIKRDPGKIELLTNIKA
ncbi:MAG TPA: DUF2073 domain-containing protein [Nanoarchaeota archaeon]|nr:DUF2073 domain-containing protein [Nanoarchaeota archaeon]